MAEVNYRKLTLSVAAGILLAGAITGGVMYGLEEYRAYQIRKRFAAMARTEVTGQGQGPRAYQQALDAARAGELTLPQSAALYCRTAGDRAADPGRAAQLRDECLRDTVERLKADIE